MLFDRWTNRGILDLETIGSSEVPSILWRADLADLTKGGLRLLLIDDEESMHDVLGVTLPTAGYHIIPTWTGEEGLQQFQSARPDLILLDLFLPDVDGKQVLRRLREWTTTPIIVMSVRHQESEKIACLDLGADDYITKPFTIGELLARFRAAMRRAFGAPRTEVFISGDLKVDLSRREVFIGTQQIKLTATEYDLLKVLVGYAGLVRTHRQLIHELWGGTQYQDSVHLLRVTVSNLRRKLVCDPGVLRRIVTEPGVGYRLRTNADRAAASTHI